MIIKNKLLNLGFGNFIQTDEVLAILNPSSSIIKKLISSCKNEQGIKDEKTGKEKGVFDFTNGRKVRSVVYCTYGRIYLSYLLPETLINSVCS
ncbi:MAG: UPF0296 protein [Candidatus Sericytochromatia bacterium]|nr:MAG: UPF0296 protein [Candidatus Sericytochromatia bacterium]